MKGKPVHKAVDKIADDPPFAWAHIELLFNNVVDKDIVHIRFGILDALKW